MGGIKLFVYFSLILLSALFFVILNAYTEVSGKNSRKIYSLVIFILIFLVGGLRDTTVGTDIQTYLYNYNNETVNLKSYMNQIDLNSFFEGFEGGFQFLNSILKTFHFNDRLYLMFYSFIFSLSFVIFYYRYSKNFFISILLYITIGNFALSMTGLRQTMAIIIVLYSFKYVIKREFLRFLLLMVIAMSFHLSSVIFIPFYFLFGLNLKKKDIALIFCGLMLLLLFHDIVANHIVPFLTPQRYLRYLNLERTVEPKITLVAISITFFSAWYWNIFENISIQEKKIVSYLFILSSMYSAVNILALSNAPLNRLSFYFMPFNNLLIPYVLYYMKCKNKKFILSIAIIILVLLYFRIAIPRGSLGVADYTFLRGGK